MTGYNKHKAALGKRLKKAREAAGLTQKQVARSMHYATAQFVSNWERGVSEPPNSSLEQLAEILGMPARELVTAVFTCREGQLADERRDAEKRAQRRPRKAS